MSNPERELSDRKKQILKAVVEAHIADGDPVGSKYLVDNQLLSCSSATIRNEMAELEEMGYLEQPHTSAGRVPSELGYRFYVDSLLKHYAMTAREVEEINTILKGKMNELDKILEIASKVASKITNYTGLAIKPRSPSISVTKYEIVKIDSQKFALVMILSNGAIKTKYVSLESELDDFMRERFSNALNRYLTGICAEDITLTSIMNLEKEVDDTINLVSSTIKVIYECMREADGGDIQYTGINQLLRYSEYSDVNKFGEILNTLEEKNEILDAISKSDSEDVNVLIGSENSLKVMEDSSIVYKQIKKDGKVIGAIGVVGPRRMDYARVLAILDELGGNISDIIGGNKQLESGGKNGGGRKEN